jgi:hypothetical protein
MDAHLLRRTFAWLTVAWWTGLERALSRHGSPFPAGPK